MDKFRRRLPFFLLLFLFFRVVFLFSQSLADSEIHKKYDELVGLESAGFYNGPEFKEDYATSSGVSRYFNQNTFDDGIVEYNGQLFAKVPLKYDIFSDNVITKSKDYLGNFIVRLIPEFISKFSIDGHDFVKLTDAKLELSGNGFYEILTVGNQFNLYLKHIRKDKERTVDLSVQHSFTNQNYYLVQYDGIFYPISSIKDFRKVVPVRYNEIQKFRKDYKFMYKANNYGFMIRLIEYLNGY